MGDVVPFARARGVADQSSRRELDTLFGSVAVDVRHLRGSLLAMLQALGTGLALSACRNDLLIAIGHVVQLDERIDAVRPRLCTCPVAMAAGLVIELYDEARRTEREVSRVMLDVAFGRIGHAGVG